MRYLPILVALLSFQSVNALDGNGTYKDYYESGQLQFDYNYSRDLLDGVIRSYTNDGNKKGKWEYNNGVKHGIEEMYYENGAIRAKLNW